MVKQWALEVASPAAFAARQLAISAPVWPPDRTTSITGHSPVGGTGRAVTDPARASLHRL